MAVDRLTERQKQCLRLVLTLGETKEIARALKISPNVVAKHIEEAMRRLGVSTRAQAALLLAQHESGGGNAPPEPEPLSYTIPVRPISTSGQSGSRLEPDVGVLREEQSIYVPNIPVEPLRLAHLLGGIRPSDLKTSTRVAIVAVLAFLLATAFGVMFIGLEALWRFGHSLRVH